MHSTTPLYLCTLVSIMFVLLWPPLTTMVPLLNNKAWPSHHALKSIKLAFYISLFQLFVFSVMQQEGHSIFFPLASLGPIPVNLSLNIDVYSVVFVTIALYVTWSIIEFAIWYMHDDPMVNRFFKYLFLFLICMIILVTADNLIQLFIGWEGVGIMSFLLIGWWRGRADANTAALEAIIYNRVGDIGLIFAIAWIATSISSFEMATIMHHACTAPLTPPLLALLLAAAGKSAQLGLHPWLPSAMEGPTPVSALLHSSTMVVAGVFLLIRFSPLIMHNNTAQTACLCLGAATTFFAALIALAQNDLKKVVAFSTTSQLGLMVVAVGLNQSQLAFMHICTHAFFKAMLFLCSASLIHCMNNEQDVRKMGGLYSHIPLTCTCFFIGSLALSGMPFLAGFFSKDAIIEALGTSVLNSWALALTLLATTLTAAYSARAIFLVTMQHPRLNSFAPLDENDPQVYKPLKRLIWGSIFAGLILLYSLPPFEAQVLTMPFSIKITACVISALGLVMGLTIVAYSLGTFKMKPQQNPNLFLTLLAFYPRIIHYLVPKAFFNWALQISTHLIDISWLDKLMPKTVANNTLAVIKLKSSMHNLPLKTILACALVSVPLAILVTADYSLSF